MEDQEQLDVEFLEQLRRRYDKELMKCALDYQIETAESTTINAHSGWREAKLLRRIGDKDNHSGRIEHNRYDSIDIETRLEGPREWRSCFALLLRYLLPFTVIVGINVLVRSLSLTMVQILQVIGVISGITAIIAYLPRGRSLLRKCIQPALYPTLYPS